MVDPNIIAKKMAVLSKTGLVCIRDGAVEAFRDDTGSSPLVQNRELREMLTEQAQKQELPYIYQDENEIYFAGMKGKGAVYLLGPMSLKTLNRVELHSFYHKYGMDVSFEKQIRTVTVSELTSLVSLFADVLIGEDYGTYTLISGNSLGTTTKEEEKREQIRFRLKQEEEEQAHHTYMEERAIINAVREGRVEDALRLQHNMDVELGRLSTNEVNHWKNASIVGITLNTRAAIEGGISPAAAYQVSDFYIQKIDTCKDIARILMLRNHAVEELAERVAKHRSRTTKSNYISRCQDYINLHYREKIYLDDLAKTLGLSSSYLSRLFKRETGTNLQDYVCQVRVERAANLLKYSDEPIARIAEYVNFPSQSYFGRVFLNQMHMTPKQYREANKMSEF